MSVPGGIVPITCWKGWRNKRKSSQLLTLNVNHQLNYICTQLWNLAKKVIKLLKVFEEATREVSREYVIIPVVTILKKKFSENVDDHSIMSMKRQMLKSIQDRYGDIEQESLRALGTILDLRFKLKGFSTASSAAHARMLLVTECASHINTLQQETENDKPQPNRRRKEKTSSELWSLFDELIAESENNDSSGNCGNESEVL